jgi:hypothetical protein
MNEAVKGLGVMSERCPYRVISLSQGLLCFDPWAREFMKPAEAIHETWCQSDFRSCPHFLHYADNLRAGMRKHFML